MTTWNHEPPVIGPRAEADGELPAVIAAAYGIGEVRTMRDLGGTYNLNLLVQTDDAQYVARVYRPWMTELRLTTIQATKHVLAQATFPVVAVMRTRRGDGMVRIGDRLLEVEPFVPHDGVADGWDRYAAAFTILGKLHALLDQPLTAASFVAPVVSTYQEPHQLVHWIEHTRVVIDARGPSEAGHRARAVCDEARACLADVCAWWDDAQESLPRQLIHGDFGGENVLFHAGQIVAVLDFDFLAWRERVFDLAYTLYWMLRRASPLDPAAFPWHQVTTLLGCYNASALNPLTDAEMDALPIEIARVPLYWIGEAHLTDDPLRSVLDRETDVHLARWLLRHRLAIRAELRAG